MRKQCVCAAIIVEFYCCWDINERRGLDSEWRLVDVRANVGAVDMHSNSKERQLARGTAGIDCRTKESIKHCRNR